MFAPFPEEEASEILQELIKALNLNTVTFRQITKLSEERKNQPLMLGALICLQPDGTKAAVITNSGISKELEIIDSSFTDSFAFSLKIAPPIVNADQINEALSQNDSIIHSLTAEINEAKNNRSIPEQTIAEKNRLLKELCAQSLEKVHNLYSFSCIDGSRRNLKEICLQYNRGKLPPTGIGDCCAPKLLHYAFSQGLKPVSLAETQYTPGRVSAGSPAVPERTYVSGGMSGAKGGHSDAEGGTPEKSKDKLLLTPPCDSRCGILLPAMLGLRILYRDQHIIVVNKQSGVLSVPGRGPEKQDCIVNRLRRLFPQCIEQPSVHRLDMETSGLLVLAFTKEAHRELNRQFENREVYKEYEALLDGVLAKKGIAKEGQMELFFRLDVDNRPHQIWDSQNGKSAVTQWEILNVEKYHAPDGSTRSVTRVRFIPHTGRTHQLRLASADSHGFGIPIIGDTLYGTCRPGERLMLHAKKIHFRHPFTGEEMDFTCEPEF